ncbi:MAG: protein kinase [Chloroflexi bacterium]|nr:protein kinase [Chloroflexota bacterium]
MSDMKSTSKSYAHYTGRQLGLYQVGELVGRGGMAEVYRSRQPELDREVAIKILHPHRTDDPNFIERFRREAKMAATLRHPHIVQVYDFAATEDGLYYMVLEFVHGQSLNLYLEQNAPLPIDKVYTICEQIMSAVQYAHERGIIHRDIKPDNIMIDPSGTAFLMDFGIAQMTAVPGLTQSQTTIGTPLYMAPEQMRSQPITTAVDIYSLGMLIYFMVTNHYPYDSDTPASLMTLKLTEPPIPPSVYVPEIPTSLETIILTALAIDPDKRFASVGHMRRVLEKSLGDKKSPPEATKILWNLLGIDNYKITQAIPAAPRSISRRFLAHNTILDQPAVIEVLNTTAERDPDIVQAFDQRINALSQIQHPRVAVVTKTGATSHDEPYVCVEYSGVPLSQKVSEWNQAGEEKEPVFALQLAVQIVGALAAGQQVGVLHNDLRADNVLYQADGSVIVAGFEVPLPASAMPTGKEDSQTWLPYYAPEQLAGGAITLSSNIYSLGVILYELLAGQRPFLIPTPLNKNAANKSPMALPNARLGLSAETYSLVQDCLQFAAEARPASLAEVETRLEKAIKAEMSPQPAATASGQRKAPPFLWAVGALLLVAALLFWAMRLNGGAAGSPTPTPEAANGATDLPVVVPVSEPSATMTSSPTATAVPTQIPASATATQSPTPTATATTTPTPTQVTLESETAVCAQTPPANWVRYQVQANDSLSKIAAAAGIAVAYLQDINCLSSITLSIGQELWVPAGASAPAATNTPTNATIPPTQPGTNPVEPSPTSASSSPTLTPPPPPTATPPPG